MEQGILHVNVIQIMCYGALPSEANLINQGNISLELMSLRTLVPRCTMPRCTQHWYTPVATSRNTVTYVLRPTNYHEMFWLKLQDCIVTFLAVMYGHRGESPEFATNRHDSTYFNVTNFVSRHKYNLVVCASPKFTLNFMFIHTYIL